MKRYEFRLSFHWSLFLIVQSTTLHDWFRNWTGAGQATSHYLNQSLSVYWFTYASLCLNELTFEMLTVRGQQHSFSTHERMFLWKCQVECSLVNVFHNTHKNWMLGHQQTAVLTIKLTCWGQDEMATISKTTVINQFSWTKIVML